MLEKLPAEPTLKPTWTPEKEKPKVKPQENQPSLYGDETDTDENNK